MSFEDGSNPFLNYEGKQLPLLMRCFSLWCFEFKRRESVDRRYEPTFFTTLWVSSSHHHADRRLVKLITTLWYSKRQRWGDYKCHISTKMRENKVWTLEKRWERFMGSISKLHFFSCYFFYQFPDLQTLRPSIQVVKIANPFCLQFLRTPIRNPNSSHR